MASKKLVPALALLVACGTHTPPTNNLPTPPPDAAAAPAPDAAPAATAPTVDEANQFVADTNRELLDAYYADARAEWVQANFITEDTDALAAAADEKYGNLVTAKIQASARFVGMTGLPPDTERQLTLLRRKTSLPFPVDPASGKELSEVSVAMNSEYSAGTYCSDKLKKWVPKDAKDNCLHLDDLSKVLEDPKATWDQQLEAWTGWRTVSVQMRPQYTRFVALSNQGAHDIGYQDTGELWKSGYDMAPADMEADVERLWEQVKPLYKDLRCYVGKKLRSKYGADKIPSGGLYPAHVFGNMWSQTWTYLYDQVKPYPKEPSIDATKGLVKNKTTSTQMVRIAEAFFVSLGMPKLPDTFWTRSLLERPRDRDVVCHASAWTVENPQDVRIKVCANPNDEDLVTLHHELGHDYYYLAYQNQPFLFQDGANDGFHEAIGDTIAKSVTPTYLANLNLIDKKAAKASDKAELNLLMHRALDRVAFLPFGLLIDKWRWEVFSGAVGPDQYNQAWWDLVAQYQGIAAPSLRGEDFFDPGAKYHVANNTPYLRYFLAAIYQFQFHKALCDAAGYQGPLDQCSIYGNKAAGDKLWNALSMGASKPWPDVMEALTGQRTADAGPMLEYFAPLQKWLEAQNQGEKCDW